MSSGLEVRECPGKGRGVFSTKPFKADDIVIVGIIEQVLDGNNAHALQVGEHTYVFPGELTSNLNHSCDPNCGIRVNEAGAYDFVAMRNIRVDEEITFDYAMENYSIIYFPKKCLCGSTNCRGMIVGWKNLTAEKKKEYEAFAAPYLIDLDARYSCGKVQRL